MVANSDLQIWQDTVKGINESGKTDLTKEEWLALTVLNGSLSSGDFQSDESRRSYQVLNDNLKSHSNNPVLQTHLQNFIDLCEQYGGTRNIGTTSPIAKPIVQPSRTAANTSSKGKGSNRNLILIATIVVGYMVYANWSTVGNVLGLKPEQSKEELLLEENHKNAIDVGNNQNNSNQTETPDVEEIEISPQSVQSPVYQTQTPSSTIPGRFPQASERLLTASDLQYLSKEDLKIMRNEIFARHGYIFQTQDMKTYFQNQSWYTPQFRDVTAKLSNIEKKNVDLIKGYENSATGSVSTKGVPPIENTGNYANANILLPKNWDGTFVLANGFVWIGSEDKKTQRKYGIYPNGENFYDDHETWDDDSNYYKYQLSPNVAIYAGIRSEGNSRKMTINEFANYMRKLGYAVEGEDAFGIVANVTYNNGTITKIVEKYTP